MLIALRHRNFRLLWIGLLVSFSGTFMQSAAVLWHVSVLVPADRRAIALAPAALARPRAVAPVAPRPRHPFLAHQRCGGCRVRPPQADADDAGQHGDLRRR